MRAAAASLLNFAIALARAKLYDFSTQAFEFAMRKADECSADEAKAKEVPEGHEEGAELTQKERLAGLNMMSAMYAEWGHLDAAVDCARRIRELGGPTARVEHETRVRCETTQGDFELSTWRTLAMLGHDNFMMLIDGDFYRDSGIYRVTDKLAQWGFASNPRTQAKHVRKFNKIDDDYSLETNVDRGTISYFGHGSKSRHTSVFIAKKFMPPEMTPSMLDAGKDTWLRPFGKVTKGMDVIDRLYGGYGEVEQEGQKDGEAGPNMLDPAFGQRLPQEELPQARLHQDVLLGPSQRRNHEGQQKDGPIRGATGEPGDGKLWRKLVSTRGVSAD